MVLRLIISVGMVLSVLQGVTLAGEYTDTEIVNAIYIAEGRDNATYLYGIRSVSYANADEARQICFNTVRNQRVRHSKHDCGRTYLECLANRYCPIDASNDPKGLNHYWLSNVKYWLKKGGQE